MKKAKDIPIEWCGGILDFSGYGYLSRHTLTALDRMGATVRALPLSKDRRFLEQLRTRGEEWALWSRLVNQEVSGGLHVTLHPPVNFDLSVDFYRNVRQLSHGFQVFVGASMFETDRLPRGWAEAHNQTDEVWVPSEFNRETYERSGVRPELIQVIPFGIDARLYRPRKVHPLDLQARGKFTFLSVFQWNKRKGWDVLLEAWLKAFRRDDNVRLVIRSYPDREKLPPIPERVRAYAEHLGYSVDAIPEIQVIEDFIPEDRMPALYAAADAFVLPTRGEGLGVPFMESMAMEKPVIATRWSAHLDFMNDSNSYLIDVEGLVPVDEEMHVNNPYYTADHRWAEPSVDHTAELLRRVYENREEARSRGRRGAKEIRQNWSVERTASWILARSEQLMEKASHTFA